MIAPLTAHMTSVTPDTASFSIKSEAPPVQTSQPEKTAAVVNTPTASNLAARDTVDLSNTALDMSKALNKPSGGKTEVEQASARQQAEAAEKGQSSYLAAGKSFPPFMGNSEELKQLKAASPSLYREVLRMIMPPPLNISLSDRQILQNMHGSDSLNKAGTTTA